MPSSIHPYSVIGSVTAMPRPYEPQEYTFACNLVNLSDYLRRSHGKYPTNNKESNKRLYRWMRHMRLKKRQNILPSSFVDRLLLTDPIFFQGRKAGAEADDQGWSEVIYCSPTAAFNDHLSEFLDHQGRPYGTGIRTVREYVLEYLRITKDIGPSECSTTDTLQVGKVNRCLGFLKEGGFSASHPIEKSWPTSSDFKSSYFGNGILVGNEGKAFESRARKSIESVVDLARTSATPEELVQKWKNTNKLDNIHTGKQGRFYTDVIRLNESMHPQPRRTTYSVTINEPRWSPLHFCMIQDLYTYGHAGRPPHDWRSRPIPVELYEFGEYLWKRLYSRLSPVSQCCPPTAVQVLHYSEKFDAKMAPHKDNGIREDVNGLQSRMSTDPILNSQIVGSSVITYSIGDAMEFGLLKGDAGYRSSQKNHKWVPEGTVTLEDGSAFVLDPQDDENYMHAAKFKKGGKGTPKDRIRSVLVFRWLSCRASFYGADKKGPRQHAQDVPNASKLFARGKYKPWKFLFK
jgi:hypothetical protein